MSNSKDIRSSSGSHQSQKSLASFTIPSYLLRSRSQSSFSNQMHLISSANGSVVGDIFDYQLDGNIAVRVRRPVKIKKQTNPNPTNDTNTKSLLESKKQAQRKFQKNCLRFFYVISKQYLLQNEFSIKRQQQWIQSHSYPKGQKDTKKILKQFHNWVKKIKLERAKHYKHVLGRKGYFETLYRVECIRFYSEDIQPYIIHHTFSRNGETINLPQSYFEKQRLDYLKSIWKMLWVIRNPNSFQGFQRTKFE